MIPDLGRATLLAYALPALVLAAPIVPAYVLLPAFYAEERGLTLSAVAAALVSARLIDIASDPLAGWLIDRFPCRFGRRKPWIALGGLLAAPALILLFAPPARADAAWLAATAATLFAGWTLIAVPYWTWGAELARDYRRRTYVTAAREGCTLAGILLSALLPAAIVQAGFDTATALRTTALAAVLAGVPAFALLLWRVPEHPAEPVARASPLILVQNRLLLRVLAIWLVNGLSSGVAGVLFPLFVTEALGGRQEERGLFLVLYIGSAVLALPIWAILAAQLGKHKSWYLSMIVAILAFAFVPALSFGDFAQFAAVCVITGAAFGADLALPPAILADVADYHRWRFRTAQTAFMFGLSSMVVKLAFAVSLAIALPLLELFGFRAGGPNDATALAALAWIYAGLPIAAKAIAAALLIGFPIDRRRHEVIRRRLSMRIARGRGNGEERVAFFQPARMVDDCATRWV